MQAVQVLAGFSPEQADDIRRAMGKRNRKTVEGYRQLFVDRLTAGGMDGGAARHLLKTLPASGSMGFARPMQPPTR